MNHEEEKPSEKGWGDFWRAKPGTLIPQRHYTLEEGAWTEISLSFTAEPLLKGEAVCFTRYCITWREEKAA